MSSPPANLEVKVTVDSGGITADPDTLQVPNGFDGTITWTLTGGEFLDPAITFDGEIHPELRGQQSQHADDSRAALGQFPRKGAAPLAYHYTLHAAPTGGALEHDPAVENEPPNG